MSDDDIRDNPLTGKMLECINARVEGVESSYIDTAKENAVIASQMNQLSDDVKELKHVVDESGKEGLSTRIQLDDVVRRVVQHKKETISDFNYLRDEVKAITNSMDLFKAAVGEKLDKTNTQTNELKEDVNTKLGAMQGTLTTMGVLHSIIKFVVGGAVGALVTGTVLKFMGV